MTDEDGGWDLLVTSIQERGNKTGRNVFSLKFLIVENILEAEAWAGYDACVSRSLG